MKVALYCRVSTDVQSIETQLLPLREYAARRDLIVTSEYSDVGVSGIKDRRPGLDGLMRAARRREMDAVVVAQFDRFARSVHHLIRSLEEFQSLGIDFINESVDTSTPMGKMLFTILAAAAELERNIIIERVKAGMDRAKKQGKHGGRPRAIFLTATRRG